MSVPSLAIDGRFAKRVARPVPCRRTPTCGPRAQEGESHYLAGPYPPHLKRAIQRRNVVAAVAAGGVTGGGGAGFRSGEVVASSARRAKAMSVTNEDWSKR